MSSLPSRSTEVNDAGHPMTSLLSQKFGLAFQLCYAPWTCSEPWWAAPNGYHHRPKDTRVELRLCQRDSSEYLTPFSLLILFVVWSDRSMLLSWCGCISREPLQTSTDYCNILWKCVKHQFVENWIEEIPKICLHFAKAWINTLRRSHRVQVWNFNPDSWCNELIFSNSPTNRLCRYMIMFFSIGFLDG